MLSYFRTRTTFALAFCAFAAGAIVPCAKAGQISAVYAFGDSLTDTGNAFRATLGAVPAAPYVNGQFSNGPVWIQTLATGLGLAPLTPSLLGGTDFAYGGAETGTTPVHAANPTDLLGASGQLAQFHAAHPTADPNALYTIWIGSNDLADISPAATQADIATDIGSIAANVDTAIGTLALEGARNFLIVTVTDLGKTPRALASGPLGSAGASALAASFDNTLVNGAGPIPSLTGIATANGLNIKVLNSYSLLDGIVSNPASFGFTDVTDACVVGAVNFAGGTVCSNTLAGQNQFLFWDAIHPTSRAHALLGGAALAVVTPEPASITLLAAGLLGLGLMRRRRSN